MAGKNDMIGRLSDRFNPLLVREIRQSFRSRIFTGVIILSSILCGCAVVASRVGGNPERVEHERTGLLFRAGDAADLAACLKK